MHRVTRVARTATKEHRRRQRLADRGLVFCPQNCLFRRDASAKPMTEHPADLIAIVGCERGRARKQRFATGRYARSLVGRPMENRGEKENPCVRALVASFSLESERSAEARKALRTRGDDGSWNDRRGKPNDMEETTGRRSLSP